MKTYIKHKLPTSHDQWLDDRLKGIGGSDAGAVLGFNQYKSPYALWCEKTGRISSEIPDNESMRQGRDLEDYVARRWMEETGKKVHRSGYSYQSTDHPFMLANVDRLVVGENAGLECKTANALTRTKYDKGDVPASYYAQCMHYMAVTGADKWYLAVLVLGKEFYTFEIQRDEAEIQSLIESEKEFWDCVTGDIEPPVDGMDSTSKALDEMYEGDDREPVYMGDADSTIDVYMEIKSKIKELTDAKKRYENQFKSELGDAQFGRCTNWIITWKKASRESLDSKKLKQDYPEVYADCLKKSEYRRLNVKEIKEND